MALLAGCGSGRASVPFSLYTGSLALPELTTRFRSTEDAVRGMAGILTVGLGLPLPERVGVFVYPGRLAFERGLVLDAGLDEARAAELSGFAIGIGGRGQLLLNRGGLAVDPSSVAEREWLRLIAHELTHVAQAELSGGEGRGEQWLAEGMAEWVAFTALERLGLDTVARRRQRATTGVLDHTSLVAARLDLEARGTPEGFTGWHIREGALPTYQLAFLMADYLVERRGFERLKRYFGSFSRSRDRHRNFEVAFGTTLAAFEGDMLTRLGVNVAATPALD
jgi:hypothetical protein